MSTDSAEPGCACAVGNEFGADSAERDLRDYRRDGPDRTTRWLLDGLRGGDGGSVDGLTVLDIGAGVGVVHLELLASGAASAVDVDGSPAYVAVARREADRTGVGERVTYLTGDFVELAPSLAPADLVALDRVVCCYPDMQALVRLSAARALRRYGLVYPRDFNGMNRLLRRRFRFHAHRTADVEATVAAAGLERVDLRRTLFWQVAVFERT
jgi:magnesium-protoporphyrin O-methyltransferase